MKTVLIAFAAWVTFLYLAGSFITMDFNCAHWPMPGRVAMMIFLAFGILGIIASLGSSDTNEGETNE